MWKPSESGVRLGVLCGVGDGPEKKSDEHATPSPRDFYTELRIFQDNWHADSKLFNEDQTLALSTIVSGPSYCE